MFEYLAIRYDTCDIGTLPNQTDSNGVPEVAKTAGGNQKYNNNLSWLPGQRLSCVILVSLSSDPPFSSILAFPFPPTIQILTKYRACTCPGDDHPGPMVNGKPIGRAAPEIDIFEAQKNKVAFGGRVTQSIQMAPFSNQYYFPNTSADVTIGDANRTSLNTYRGSAL